MNEHLNIFLYVWNLENKLEIGKGTPEFNGPLPLLFAKNDSDKKEG
jgi:hypothetical protein